MTRVRRIRGAAHDHSDQGLWHQRGQRQMHDKETDDRRHAKEMHDPRKFITAEQPGQFLQLDRLPDAKPGKDCYQGGRQDAPIEHLLDRIVFAELMAKPAAQCRKKISQKSRDRDRQEIAAESDRKRNR